MFHSGGNLWRLPWRSGTQRTLSQRSLQKRLVRKEKVSDLLSVSLVFFALKIEVEVGWCGVESRVESPSVISGFTHSFFRLLTWFPITFRQPYLCDSTACYFAYKILMTFLISNNQHPDNSWHHIGSTPCSCCSKLPNQLLPLVSILIGCWLLQLHLTDNYIARDDQHLIGHSHVQLLHPAQSHCQGPFPTDWRIAGTAAIANPITFQMMPQLSLAPNWDSCPYDFSWLCVVRTRDFLLTALECYPTKLRSLLHAGLTVVGLNYSLYFIISQSYEYIS